MKLLAGWAVVFAKEIVDGIRDKRSLWSVLISSVVGPVLVGVMFNSMAARQRSADDITLPVAGVEYAPAFVDWLGQQSGVIITPAPADPVEAVRQRKQDAVLIIDKEFPAKFARSLPAPVKLVSDATSDRAGPKLRRVRELVRRYSAEIGTLRLVARGVSPSVANAVDLEDVEVSSAQQRAARILGFLSMFLMLAAFAGSMQVASDSTAGERERGSLEPLLLNPVPRLSLITGKWLAASCFGMAAVLLSGALCALVMRQIPLHDLGASFRFGPREIALLLAVVMPAPLVCSAMILFVAIFARSYKEAQSYLGLLILVPMLPGMLSTIWPMTNRPWLAPVPVIGQYALMNDILGGKPPSAWFIVLAGLATAGAAWALVVLTSRLLERERIIFGRG